MIRQKTLEIVKGSIKNEQFREIGNKRQSEDKQNKNTPRYVLDTTIRQTNKNHVHKTRSFLQTIRGKDEPNIVFIRKSQWTNRKRQTERKFHFAQI